MAAVASQADSWISDVKLYQTLVTVDFEVLPDGTRKRIANEQLKPDMTAEVTITVDTAKEPVLTVPVQAIIGGAEMGAKREVFVKTPTGHDRREVKLGLYNEKVGRDPRGAGRGRRGRAQPEGAARPRRTGPRPATTGGKGGDKGGGDSKGEGGAARRRRPEGRRQDRTPPAAAIRARRVAAAGPPL